MRASASDPITGPRACAPPAPRPLSFCVSAPATASSDFYLQILYIYQAMQARLFLLSLHGALPVLLRMYSVYLCPGCSTRHGTGTLQGQRPVLLLLIHADPKAAVSFLYAALQLARAATVR